MINASHIIQLTHLYLLSDLPNTFDEDEFLTRYVFVVSLFKSILRMNENYLKAHISFSLGVPDEVTSIAIMNSVKSMLPFLSASKFRNTF